MSGEFRPEQHSGEGTTATDNSELAQRLGFTERDEETGQYVAPEVVEQQYREVAFIGEPTGAYAVDDSEQQYREVDSDDEVDDSDDSEPTGDGGSADEALQVDARPSLDETYSAQDDEADDDDPDDE